MMHFIAMITLLLLMIEFWEEAYMTFIAVDTMHEECTRSSRNTNDDAMDFGADE